MGICGQMYDFLIYTDRDKNLYQLSAAVMKMVVGMRTQLLGQLWVSSFVKARGPDDIFFLSLNKLIIL